MSILFSLSSSSVFFVFYPKKMDVRSFSGPANKEGDLLTFLDGLLGLLHFYISFFFCLFQDAFFFFFADCNSVEKEHWGMFYLLETAFQRSSSGTLCVCAKLRRKNKQSRLVLLRAVRLPPGESLQLANSATDSWHLNSWLVIMDRLHLSPPEALQYRFLLILWLFFIFSYFAISHFLHAIGVREERPTPDRMKYCWSAFDFQIAKLFLLTVGESPSFLCLRNKWLWYQQFLVVPFHFKPHKSVEPFLDLPLYFKIDTLTFPL